ncbi:beta strand repeat-containing protein [Alicyclobacillus sp. ALC3]|uniref:beta strand repeat-containing protein n=1 Tax=Alicyclobacillus sp. ALC3 TaxID=2796143 RepID=UPI002379424F|nr:putative Ig domain-containing protein [Alicyclobacillus sp. ALC3]WDL95304.1 putative Ig domain-containing protein [Alicyclobacillus sp. ALC3]
MRRQKENRTGNGRRALNATTAVMITLGTAMNFATPQVAAQTTTTPVAPSVQTIGGTTWVVVSSAGNLLYIDQNQTSAITAGSTTDYMNANIRLSGTISMSGVSGWVPMGGSGAPFVGTFDGAGNQITGLTINPTGRSNSGLFGVFGTSGTIENLGVNAQVTGGTRSQTAILVGMQDGGTITDSYTTGSVTGRNVAGLVNELISGAIEDSYSTAKVNGEYGGWAGGLVGTQSNGVIQRSYAAGNVSGDGRGGAYGGLVTIQFGGTIQNSYATGNVTGPGVVGGLVGWMEADVGTIQDSYAVGSVSGGTAGRLVGGQDSGTITDVYFPKGSVSAIGSQSGGVDTGVAALNSAQMTSAASYAGFDFTGTWAVDPSGVINGGMPYIQAMYPTITSSLSAHLSGTTLSGQLSATGGSGEDTWSVSGLPSGVSYDPATGAISGTVTTLGIYTITATVTDSLNLADTRVITLDLGQPLVLSVPSSTTIDMPPSGQTTDSLPWTPNATGGGGGSYTWSLNPTPLDGLQLTPSGSWTGTLAAPGQFSTTIDARSNLGVLGSATVSLDVLPTLLLNTTSPLPEGEAGLAYHDKLSASGGSGSYTWSLASGTTSRQTDGLSLSSGGVLSGDPAGAGTFTFTATVADGYAVESRSFTLDVLPALALKTTSPLPEGETGISYQQSLSASGGSGSYTWALASGTTFGETDGLSLSSGGVLSGDLTGHGTFTFTATVSDGYAVESRSFTLDVLPVLVLQTTSPLPEGEAGIAYQKSLSATGGSGSYTWALASGTTSSETDGLSLSSRGVLSGSPTGPGTFTFTATVADGYATESRSFTLDVAPALSPLSSVRQMVLAGWPDTYTFTETGGYGPYTWSLASGTLPPGYTLTSGGVLSGQSNRVGTYAFTVRVTDSLGATRLESATWVIEQAVSPLTVQSITLGAATEGSLYEQTLIANGGKPAYTWSLVGGSLPAGVVLNSDGVVQGTPTASGTYTFTVEVRDTAGHTATATDTLTVEAGVTPVTPPVTPPTPVQNPPLVIGAGSLPGATAGTAYSGSLAASGGDGTYQWSLASGTLPRGLMIAVNGTLFGTPQTMGMSTFTLRVTDKSGDVATKTFHLFVMPQLLPAYDRVIEVNGQVFSLSPSMAYNQTTYMPIWYVENVLKSAGVNAVWNGNLNRWDLTVNTSSGAFAGVKPHLLFNNHGTPVYVNGVLVLHAPTVAHRDPTDGVMTTYMGIWYVQQVLKELGIVTTWNGHVWNFLLPGVQ